MPPTEADLKRAALEFLEAADAVAADASRRADEPSGPDPLDAVSSDLFTLGDLDPVIDPRDLASLKDRLRRERLLPETVVELVALARRVAGTLTGF
jgi:hypothetical protein